MNGMQKLKRGGENVNPVAGLCKTMAHIDQDGIDQLQLPLEFLRPFTTDIRQYPGQLASENFSQAFRGILNRK